jgi:murein DD-endopeptidase MepM/ murein hydrolase activator NlpD
MAGSTAEFGQGGRQISFTDKNLKWIPAYERVILGNYIESARHLVRTQRWVQHMTRLITVLIILTMTLWAVSIALAVPTKMPSGFYYPTDRIDWTGNNGSDAGDPKQPWNDAGRGGRIYGYLDPNGPRILGKNHVGMDIRQSYNSPVYAITDGIIHEYMNTDPSRYWCIVVKHREARGSYFYTVYGHCRLKAGLSVGSAVAAGEAFAYVNENNNQHLHFGIKVDPDFSTGWGSLELGLDANSAGWRPPRTWLFSHSPYGSLPETDDSAPSITLTGPAAYTRSTTVQQITWSVADDESGVDTVTLRWDSGALIAIDDSGSMFIPNGNHTVTIRATDMDRNTVTVTGGPYVLDVPSFVVSIPPGLLTGGYFVQKPDRSYGMYVELNSSFLPDIAIGDEVAIYTGVLVTTNGGKVLRNGSMAKVGLSTGSPPLPIATNIKKLASGSTYSGLLVTITGRVSYRDPKGSFFYVDDGSGARDAYYSGIRALCKGFAVGYSVRMPQLGQLVSVTGVRWTQNVLGAIVPSVQPRFQEDIIARDRAAR